MNKQDITTLLKNQDWEAIIFELTDFTLTQLALYQLLNEKKSLGIEAKDLVMDSIYKVISFEWSWDPDKSDLITYLKFHVIRGLITNFIHSKKFITNSEKDIELLQNTYISGIITNSEIDLSDFLQSIRNLIKDDKIAAIILEGFISGLKKNQICDEYNLSLQEYNNGYKRMKRKLIKAGYKDQIRKE